MKAVISVIGKDTVGILAAVSTVCAEANANVQDVTQSILGDIFAMIMVVVRMSRLSSWIILMVSSISLVLIMSRPP